MKAMAYHEYGTVDGLRMEDVPTPEPRRGEVQVQVHCSSVNSWDWDLVRGKPFIARIGGLLRPEHQILGADIAGTVASVGPGVAGLEVGDEVFGDVSECGWGGFGEFVAVPATTLARKSPSMTFEEAAATPQAGLLALQGLRYKGRIDPGDTVLVNGAGGGVGTFALQMAKTWGATVTGVDNAAKHNTLKEAGADIALDYRTVDFTKTGERYDRILDVVGNRSLGAYRRALEPGGAVGLVGGRTSTLIRVAVGGLITTRSSDKEAGVVVHRPNPKDLDVMTALFETGSVVPVIDTVYPLEQVPEAIGHVGEGNAHGKVVISVIS